MNELYKSKQGKFPFNRMERRLKPWLPEFDAIVIPGGMAPDKMRINPNTVGFVQEAMGGKLVAAACHLRFF